MSVNPLAVVREFSPRTRAVLAVNAVNSFGGGLVLPFLWIYLGEIRGLAAWIPAATLAVQAGTAVFGGLAWGAVLDRLAPRSVVTLVMCVAGAGTGLYAFATSAPTALTAAVVYGLGISGVGTVLRFLYAGAATARERGLAFSADYAVFNAMTGLGVLVGGLVAASGPGSDAARFAALYLADGCTFLAAGAAFFLLLPRLDRATGPSATPAEAGTARRPVGYREVLGQRTIAVLLATLTLCSLVSYGQLRSGLPGYLTAGGAIRTRRALGHLRRQHRRRGAHPGPPRRADPAHPAQHRPRHHRRPVDRGLGPRPGRRTPARRHRHRHRDGRCPAAVGR